MAMGIPTVCVRGSGGPAEQIADTGFIEDRFDSILLGDAILRLLVDQDLLRSFGQAARERALRLFSKSAVVPRIWAEIERTIAEKPGSR
jgi:glycosyltransferase involved in cell wall biosynthesis